MKEILEETDDIEGFVKDWKFQRAQEYSGRSAKDGQLGQIGYVESEEKISVWAV